MSNYDAYDDDDDDFESDSVLEAASDVDSNFADSPADGYFSDRMHPQDTFVENSTMTGQEDSKAREAAEHRPRTSSYAQSSHVYTSQSNPPAPWAPAEMPANNSDPPPDYESATSSRSGFRRPSNNQADHSTRYSSGQADNGSEATNPDHAGMANENEMHWPFGNRGSPFHSGFPFGPAGPPLGPFGSLSGGHEQPQTMSDRPVQSSAADEETGLLSGRRGRWSRKKRGCCAGFCKALCNTILFLAVLGVLLLLIRNFSGMGRTSNDGNGGHDKSPGDSPIPGLPSNPAVPSAPPLAGCPYEHYSKTSTFEFTDLRNFSFNEFMESEHLSGGVRGTVFIQAAPQRQDADLKLSVTYALTRPWTVLRSNYVQSDDTFVLQAPTLQNNHQEYSSNPCIWIFVRMEVRPGVTIQSWELNTGNLNIEVDDSLFDQSSNRRQAPALQVEGSSSFNAVRGSADIAYWSSRETTVELIAGSIRGSFALRDLLSLKTQAGSIKVNVDPKAADERKPKPAEFFVTSKAGSITANFPLSGHIPSREYRTRIESYSSSIRGSYILGALTSINSGAGSTHVDLLPFMDEENQFTKLRTDSQAGSTRLNILSPYGRSGQPWTAESSHKTSSTTGSINVIYPREWEGKVSCESLSGSVNVKGKGVEITKDERWGPVRHVEAKKGDGAGKVSLESRSSSVTMQVGEL